MLSRWMERPRYWHDWHRFLEFFHNRTMVDMLKKFLIYAVGGLLAVLQPVWSAPGKAGLAFEEGFSPNQDLTVWPLEIAHGYPLVRAQVGDVKGMFLLDTGTPWGLLLNSARVKLPDATPALTGNAGSGQALKISRSTHMPAISIQGQSWTQVRNVHSADLSFIEQGTGMGPYLGFIGANFLKDSALTLDYARRVAFVQRLHPDTSAPLAALPAAQSGGTRVASVFYRAERPSFPVFDASLGGKPVRVMLDSGNPGASIDTTWLATLREAGVAAPFSLMNTQVTYHTGTLLLGGVTLPLEDVSAYDAVAVVAGQADHELLRIGYSLLKRWGVTWNYRLQSMTFFTP